MHIQLRIDFFGTSHGNTDRGELYRTLNSLLVGAVFVGAFYTDNHLVLVTDKAELMIHSGPYEDVMKRSIHAASKIVGLKIGNIDLAFNRMGITLSAVFYEKPDSNDLPTAELKIHHLMSGGRKV